MSEMDVRGDSTLGEAAAAELSSDEISIEAPEADAAEQQRSVRDREEEQRSWPRRFSLEVDPSAGINDERTVDLDEDDYR